MPVFYVTGWHLEDAPHAHMNVIEDDSPNNNNNTEKHRLQTLEFGPAKHTTLSVPDPPGTPFWYSSRRTIPPSPKSTSGHMSKDKKRKSKPNFSIVCVLAFLLIFFMVFSVIITSLFLWHLQFVSCPVKGATTKKNPVSPAPSTGCPVLPDPIPLRTLPDSIDRLLKNMDALIKSELPKNQATAVMSNIVYRDKVIWSGGYGVMDRKEQPPRAPNTSTVFPIASVAKVFTALLLFKLYNDKKVTSLDQPVDTFEPNFDVKNPYHDHKMTLKELAAMRSGFQREAPCYPDNRTNLCPHDHVTMINRIRNLTLIHDSNKRPYYSNLGYAVLGQVLAKHFHSGDFEELMKDEIFKPLRMYNSSFSMPRNHRSVPLGYMGKVERTPLEWGWLAPTGGIFTTVDDLAKMEIALMTDNKRNRFLSAKITEEFLSDAYILPNGANMIGMPWEMTFQNGTIFREKIGSVYGYDSFISLIPELQLGLNLFCTDCGQKLQTKLVLYYRNEIVPLFQKELRKLTTKKPVLPLDPGAFIGNYNVRTIPGVNSFTVALKDGQLIFSINNYEAFYLNYKAPLTFELFALPGHNCIRQYSLGGDNDIVVFSSPSSRDGLSHQLVIYGAHPSGRTYADRVIT